MVTCEVQGVCRRCNAVGKARFASNCQLNNSVVFRLDCPHIISHCRATTWTGWLFGGNAHIDGQFDAKCKACERSMGSWGFGFWGWPQHDSHTSSLSCPNCDNGVAFQAMEPHHWCSGVVTALLDPAALIRRLFG